MKYFKYIALVILLILIGYGVFTFIQAKQFENNQIKTKGQVSINFEKDVVIKKFNEYMANYQLKFNNYYSAKNYFQEYIEVGIILDVNIWENSQFSTNPTLVFKVDNNGLCETGYLDLITKKVFIQNECTTVWENPFGIL